MTWLARLAALGCLIAACAVTDPVITLALLLFCFALVLLTFQGRLPWCLCGHGKTVHSHYRPGNDCSLCECEQYRAPFIWRKHDTGRN